MVVQGAAIAVVTCCGATVIEELKKALLVDGFLPERFWESCSSTPEALDGKIELLVGLASGQLSEFLPFGRELREGQREGDVGEDVVHA